MPPSSLLLENQECLALLLTAIVAHQVKAVLSWRVFSIMSTVSNRFISFRSLVYPADATVAVSPGDKIFIAKPIAAVNLYAFINYIIALPRCRKLLSMAHSMAYSAAPR